MILILAICLDSDIITKKQADEVHELKDKINGIREVLARKHMKVVFFGRYVIMFFILFFFLNNLT